MAMKSHHQDQVAVRIDGVSKEYVIHHEKPTLVEKFVKTAKFKRDERFWALRDVNLTVRKGERVGIIGPNGSGKTTLLKIITGITTPTRGSVTTNGKIVSLIDLDAGFHPDLTGIQNIYLNGSLLGMSKEEMDRKIDSIISFADIHQFIDTPLFTYSSGMCLRLGFSVAIHSDPDIIILDENLNVGDKNFQAKSLLEVEKLISNGVTLILVSHYKQVVYQFCDRIVEMKNGEVISDRNYFAKSLKEKRLEKSLY